MNRETYQIRTLERTEYGQWDELIKLSPYGSVFSLSGWLSATSRSLDTPFEIVGCYFDDNLVGGCPIFFKKKFGILTLLTNIQGMMPYSGIIIEDYPQNNVRKFEKHYTTILSSIVKHFEQLRFYIVSITNPPKIQDIRPFTWRGWKTDVKYAYFLNLDNLNYSRDVKRNINRAIKNEVLVGRSSDIASYYSLFRNTFERQELKPPVSEKYIKILYQYIIDNDLGELWVAKTPDEQWIAAEIYLHDNNYLHRWTAATDAELRKGGGYHFLLDSAFRYYHGKGYSTVNLMAGNTPQLTEFITGLNPYLVPYYSVNRVLFEKKLFK